jgi:hypothetical protein
MADLGDLLGSLMSGLIRARQVADEQTAALAEYYKSNPLLEGLSIPRIRIPELTIDLPFLIEGNTEGESGAMSEPKIILAAVESQLKQSLANKDIKINANNFHKEFISQVSSQLDSIKQSGTPIMKESISRSVQDAFTNTLAKMKVTMTASEKENVIKDLVSKVSAVSIAKLPIPPTIAANVKTADVKERSSDTNVVRLKITMKEEGLEWAVRSNQSGGVERTLQPE